MDRSRRGEPRLAKIERSPTEQPVPPSSRLTVRGKKNRRRPASLWSRVPRPRAIADACGHTLRRAVPALVATCAITAVGTGLWLGYRFVTTSDRYAIEEIQVHGVERLSPDAVRAALPVTVGDNVFTANLDGIAAQLRAHPWIATAEAHRILPHTLVIDVREYEPVAIVSLRDGNDGRARGREPGGELYLVDGAGHPFKRVDLDAGDGAGLPIVTGIPRGTYQRDPAATARSITTALGVLARWREAERPAIGELHVDATGSLSLHTYDSGTSIELGRLADAGNAADLATRIRTFDAAWGALTDSERVRARTIHLDARSDHATVAFSKD